MFNSLAQYFLGTSNNSNNLDPGSKTNHQEVPTNAANNDHHLQHVEQALAQQNAFQVYPNKRGRARRNRKNKVQGNAAPGAGANPKGLRSSQQHSLSEPPVEDLLEECLGSEFLLHGITTRICEEEDEEWLFVECAQKANKKNGIISLLHDDDDLLDVDIACLPEGGSPVYEPPKPRFEIKHNPLNLNQQQLKRQLRQQNAALISCEDIEDDEELKRATAANGAAADSGRREAVAEASEEIQVIDPEQSAVVEGNSVDVEVPPVAVERPAVSGVRQQQRQAHGDEESSDRRKARSVTVSPSAPVEIKQQRQPQNMEESWFVTPPSCFTSQGPVHMETSPLENLLIEHPSMSVYHGVRSMDQSADIGESLVVLEKEVKMDQQQEEEEDQGEAVETAPTSAPSVAAAAGVERTPVHAHKVAFVGGGGEEDSDQDDYDDEDDEELESTTPAVRSERPFNYVSNREEKQSLMFRNAQMNHDKKMRSKLCRNAMTRSNKTCEMNATKNGPKKRSEKQHAKNVSRANNNRSKC